MMIVGDENEQKEDELLNNNCDVENYIEDVYSKYKNIYKIILLCLCLIIIIIPYQKKNFNKLPNSDPLPSLGQETRQNQISESDTQQKTEQKTDINQNGDKEKATDQKSNTKTDKEPEQEQEQKSDNKIEKEPEQKTDNKIEKEPEQKSDIKPDKEPEQQPEPKIIKNETIVNLYISTHKDFNNKLIVNPNYKILCDDRSQLKNNYSIEIISTNTSENILFPKRIGYGEGSKMYYIWNLYKSGNISSKYVGFFHYKRIFNFKNNIPDLDTIFKKYDGMVMTHYYFKKNNYHQYVDNHIAIYFDEALNILREKYPEYIPILESYLKRNYQNYCNIFIMKKDDFIKWGDFVYSILLELDRRFNLTSDEDTRNSVEKEIEKIKGNLKPYESKQKLDLNFQRRMQGFVMERLTNVFYDKYFKNRYELNVVGK